MRPNIIWEKLRNLSEIALLPGGVRLKMRHRNFHWRDYRVCLRLKCLGVEPNAIFDIGANEGQFAIGALTAFPRAIIYCYEPGKHAFERLSAAFYGNPSVHLISKAVGQEEGQATLRVTSADQSSSILELHKNHIEAYPEVRELRQETVAVTTLDKEFERVGLTPSTLLKIDTQGFEFEVLKGAREVLSGVRWILFETATRPMYQGEVLFSDISSWLEQRGFSFVAPIELHVNSEGRLCQFDVLFENPMNSR
jgi:FkbM family methyltransferase